MQIHIRIAIKCIVIAIFGSTTDSMANRMKKQKKNQHELIKLLKNYYYCGFAIKCTYFVKFDVFQFILLRFFV